MSGKWAAHPNWNLHDGLGGKSSQPHQVTLTALMGQTPAVRVRKGMTRTNPSEIEEIDCNYPKLSKDHCKQFGCHRLDTVHLLRHEMNVFSSQNVTKPSENGTGGTCSCWPVGHRRRHVHCPVPSWVSPRGSRDGSNTLPPSCPRNHWAP